MFNRYNRNALLFPSVTFLARVPGAKALHRSIGGLDPLIKQAVDTCFALPNLTFNGAIVGYGAGKCPNLINCIYNNLDAADQAGLSAGTSIACLLPTVLALIGAGPIELIQLAFASPIRAAATCLFGVGLPSGLFRQLRTGSRASGGHSEMHATHDPRSKQWQIYIARPRATKIDILRRVLADCIIVGLGCVMLWRNWIIGSVTMVTFRCEYSWLLFCWPMACLVWLALASLALYCMAKEIEITLDGHHRSFIEILLLPYRFSPTAHGHPSHSHSNLLPQSIPPSPSFPVPVPHLAKTDPTGPRVPEPPLTADSRWASSEQQMTQAVYGGSAPAEALHPRRRAAPPDVKILESPPPTATKHHSEPRTAVGLPGQSFTVTITMRHESFWEWYEAGLETVAVGVYLYATIVLGSILFLTGQSGIEYTVLMVLSLAVIRIVGNVM